MKLWSSEHTFSHPWKQVTEAAWHKYPNDLNTNVRAIDVIKRNVSRDGKLTTTRLFGTQWNIPTFITSLLGMPDMCYAVECSEVDMKNQEMTLKMVNYTFCGILAVKEKLVYTPNPENPQETHLSQGAKIEINGLQFSNYFEGLIVNSFELTSHKGRIALEQVLNKIKIENIFQSVTKEIGELSEELDRAAEYLEDEFHLTEKLRQISGELDGAAAILNNEIKIFSSQIQTELTSLLHNLHDDLNRIASKVSNYELHTGSQKDLVSLVKQYGITGKSSR